jgi:hypothetical protein
MRLIALVGNNGEGELADSENQARTNAAVCRFRNRRPGDWGVPTIENRMNVAGRLSPSTKPFP